MAVVFLPNWRVSCQPGAIVSRWQHVLKCFKKQRLDVIKSIQSWRELNELHRFLASLCLLGWLGFELLAIFSRTFSIFSPSRSPSPSPHVFSRHFSWSLWPLRPCLLTGVLELRSDAVGVLIYRKVIFGSQVKPLTFRSGVLKGDLIFAESCIPNPV